MKTIYKHLSLPLLVTLACIHAVHAAPVNYSTIGSSYTEDFNSNLPGGAETFTWTQGTIFGGWYAQFANLQDMDEPTSNIPDE